MSTSAQGLAQYGLQSQDEAEATEAKDLTRAWFNEKFSPEILPFQSILVDNLMEQLANQKEFVEENRTDNVNNAFVANLYLMEIERVKYLLRSYLKTRLGKIDKYGQHILADDQLKARLSKHELEYLKSVVESKKNHFLEAGMGELKGDTEKENAETVRIPNTEVYVFCRVLEDIGEFMLEEGVATTNMMKGNIFAVRYRSIISLVQESKVELI